MPAKVHDEAYELQTDTTSTALPQSIGTAAGAVLLEESYRITRSGHLGQPVATGFPQLLHSLRRALQHGASPLVAERHPDG